MSHRVRCHLRSEINHYDEAIRRFIPGYETMITEAASAVAATRPDRGIDPVLWVGLRRPGTLKHGLQAQHPHQTSQSG